MTFWPLVVPTEKCHIPSPNPICVSESPRRRTLGHLSVITDDVEQLDVEVKPGSKLGREIKSKIGFGVRNTAMRRNAKAQSHIKFQKKKIKSWKSLKSKIADLPIN